MGKIERRERESMRERRGKAREKERVRRRE